MFYNFKNFNINLNNNTFLINDLELSQQLELDHAFKIGERITKQSIPKSPYVGNLKIRYYLTGHDYLKEYVYSNEFSTITGNINGLIFTQGYLSEYSVDCAPNSPVQINANIVFYDKISGTFTPSTSANFTGSILRMSDVSINNFIGFTNYPLTNITKSTFNYTANITPSYSYRDTGISPVMADRVSIAERRIVSEITSDNVVLDIPLSGDQFGLILTFQNPINNSINESFGCSGKVNYKSINVEANNIHYHVLKVSQNNTNPVGEISGVIINPANFVIVSSPNSNPFTSYDGTLQYVDSITVGDTYCNNFTTQRFNNHDTITVSTPVDIVNDILTVYTTNGAFLWPQKLFFNYSGITITGISANSGAFTSALYISGTNFYKIDNLNFNGGNAFFQILSPTLILTVVPTGTSGPINVVSNRRGLTGTSLSGFFCQPTITLLSPVTGIWGNTLTLGGYNFSGITGIFFNGVNATGFQLLNNQIISVQTPNTGNGYYAGYVSVLGSGGYSQSISQYIPSIPMYSITPSSGVINTFVKVATLIDTGFYFATGGGYKVRLGGIDTIFAASGTGLLTGVVPVGATTDYFYIYRPDGVSTFDPGGLSINAITYPVVFSITPATISQYRFFNPVLLGENFEFFFNQLFYVAISGGINNDFQIFSGFTANSGGNADTLQINNAIVTGATGYYNIITQNMAGASTFISGLLVTSGINQSLSCLANISTSLTNAAAAILVKLSAPYSIDNSTGTFSYMVNSTAASGSQLTIVPKNNNTININLVKIVMANLSPVAPLGARLAGNPTGDLSLWYKNANSPFYHTSFVNLSGFTLPLFNSGVTGVRTIRIATPSTIADFGDYLGLSEVQLF